DLISLRIPDLQMVLDTTPASAIFGVHLAEVQQRNDQSSFHGVDLMGGRCGGEMRFHDHSDEGFQEIGISLHKFFRSWDFVSGDINLAINEWIKLFFACGLAEIEHLRPESFLKLARTISPLLPAHVYGDDDLDQCIPSWRKPVSVDSLHKHRISAFPSY